MTLLNTGIGFIVYGSPFLLIVLTILVSAIETAYTRNYQLTFGIRMKKLLVANAISTSVGLLIMAIVLMRDSLSQLVEFITDTLSVDKFSIAYLILLTTAIAIPSYAITIAIEFVCLKKIIWKEIKTKDILIGNLISYGVLLILWLTLTLLM